VAVAVARNAEAPELLALPLLEEAPVETVKPALLVLQTPVAVAVAPVA
jgi:hypothetical protein